MRLLVFGASGQVGREILGLPVPVGVELEAPPRSSVDLGDRSAIKGIIGDQKWDAVINAAGYTDVDGAESNQTLAFRINSDAVEHLAIETGRLGIPLIHISTDYVFDGKKERPYSERDDPSPLNVYGRSKLAGEQALRNANAYHIILRTSWVFSPFGKNFVKTILRLAQNNERLNIVADQLGRPTAARDIAKISLELALTCVRNPQHTSYGLFNCAGSDDATWHELAVAIVNFAQAKLGRKPEVMPIRTDQYPTAATRPADSRLDSSALARAFGVAPNSWRVRLPETIDKIFAQEGVR